MRKLPYVILLLLGTAVLHSQSPHGSNFKVDCKLCHTSDSWGMNMDVYAYNHDSTNFPLQGQHQVVDCRMCHISLEFEKADLDCASCHLDIHERTAGFDCFRCHNLNSWLVEDIAEIHQQNDFPLLGVHGTAQCDQCHLSKSLLRFDPIGNECINCHQEDYAATSNPNHQSAGYSTDCNECHNINSFEWTSSGFNHDFFPLTNGHDITECAKCHETTNYADASPECITCHQSDYQSATNPDHLKADISTDCAACHTTNPDWIPAEFKEHDSQFFPIYSGEHGGEWDQCMQCHTNPDNYSSFSCLECHEHNPTETDQNHDGISGYEYSSTACLACHPTGSSDETFDHNKTHFPLSGAHTSVECISCHVTGYTGTSTECVDCHTADFNATTNPDHQASNLPQDCAGCHTTEPGWSPALFPNHNEYYALNGEHALIAEDCASCHNGDFANTPNTCAGCHQNEYDATSDPPHASLQFNTDCATCHTENAWEPATFDHDGQYFPINSGAHQGTWDQCVECHINTGNYSIFSCVDCHEHNRTEADNDHAGISGYSFSSTACLACHPTGSSDETFDHSLTNFPLTGAHTTVECISCHISGYTGTFTECVDCHTADFNATTNPNHQTTNISTDCASCHTTDPGWSPASFPDHNSYYALNGAHAVIATDCASCHNGDFTNTPNTCAGCHQDDYDATADPPHSSLQFNTDCATCHTENAWEPATFDHDGQYFPINSGTHQGTWDQCIECHTNSGNYSIFSCTDCHEHNRTDTDNDHTGISGYSFSSTACLACHPTGEADGAFDHNLTNFPLTGAHTTVECLSCHAGGYTGTSTLCLDCHTTDFNATTNPNHQTTNISTDCASCHTTDPGWSPASFPEHNNYYALNGAHALIATDCASCHNGDFTNTPNTCAGCHQDDYDATADPPHSSLQFNTDCATCHTENAWEPATFDHDGQYFPINSGTHQGTWDQCLECHTSSGNYSIFSCTDCHEHNRTDTDNDHTGISGYSFSSTACLACHPTGEADGAFDHNLTNFPLTGAHTTVECLSCHAGGYTGTSTLCLDCHTTDFNATTNPNHQTTNISTNCASCHSTDPGWSPASFPDHNSYYTLNGAHALIATDCASCHNGNYTNTPNTCTGCHIDDYNATTDPPHATQQYSTNCASCHSGNAWEPATFDHNTTNFPLTGAHTTIDCNSCHSGGYAGTSTVCVDCHTTDFNATTNPDHQSTNISTDCASCHSTDPGWSPASFPDHNSYYALNGAHALIATDCASCHNGDYTNTPNTCTGCHIDDYNATTDPPHATEQYSTNCASCHTESAWEPSTFDHNATNFPLTGAHTTAGCISCHAGGYAGTSTVCADCHTTDFNATTNPDHQSTNISTDCASCHSTDPGWSPASFPDHNSYYALNGAHALITTDCASCHNGDYTNTPNTCASCHIDDYNATTDPPHATQQYSTNCASCHTENAWEPSTFDHNATNFPLTGAHITTDCNSCHAGGYAGTSTVCADCHMTDFNATTNPDHQTSNISTDCASCHTTDPGWSPASFPEHNNYYALNGAHALIATDCASCHNGDYTNTPNTCAGCHIDDFNATNDPPHAIAQFPLDCASCHSESAWEPATFDHDDQYFPIYSGNHRNEWNNCSECHTNSGNYSIFSCIDCHEHNKSSTDNDHDEVNGYSYSSTACLDCHPNGNE